MTPAQVIRRIQALCGEDGTDFVAKTKRLYEELEALDDGNILTHIEEGGMIPEDIGHDSSEEKLFAKYCDYLLARGLSLVGIPSKTITERADAADVEGEAIVDQQRYRIVGDAKAFRLSRTAKNQKDFKVDALDRWKKGVEYAVLLGPLYQYPTRTSQIYQQAIEKRVTLLSFTHLGFLIKHRASLNPSALHALWSGHAGLAPSKEAHPYWARIDELVCAAAGQNLTVLRDYKRAVLRKVHKRADEQLAHWAKRRQEIEEMSPEQLRAKLIRAERIDSNIKTISGFIKSLEGATEL
jgi:hypothetical protein